MSAVLLPERRTEMICAAVERCAGIDVGKTFLAVCVMTGPLDGKARTQKRRFGTIVAELESYQLLQTKKAFEDRTAPPLDERQKQRLIRHHIRRLGKLGIAVQAVAPSLQAQASGKAANTPPELCCE
jgi:hypothetical protein